MARGGGRSSRNSVRVKGVSTESVVICVLLVVLLVLVVYYVRQNNEGFQAEGEPCKLMFFVAKWCPHCKNAKPVIDQVKKNAPSNVDVVVVDEAEPEAKPLMKEYNIRGFPTVVIVKKNGEIVEYNDAVKYDKLNSFIQAHSN